MEKIIKIKEINSFINNFENKFWNDAISRLIIIGIRYIQNYYYYITKIKFEDLNIILENMNKNKSCECKSKRKNLLIKSNSVLNNIKINKNLTFKNKNNSQIISLKQYGLEQDVNFFDNQNDNSKIYKKIIKIKDEDNKEMDYNINKNLNENFYNIYDEYSNKHMPEDDNIIQSNKKFDSQNYDFKSNLIQNVLRKDHSRKANINKSISNKLISSYPKLNITDSLPIIDMEDKSYLSFRNNNKAEAKKENIINNKFHLNYKYDLGRINRIKYFKNKLKKTKLKQNKNKLNLKYFPNKENNSMFNKTSNVSDFSYFDNTNEIKSQKIKNNLIVNKL